MSSTLTEAAKTVQKLKRKCAQISEMDEEGMMRSVTVRLRAAEFSATMTAMREWLDANRYEPTMYKYAHDEHTVLVTVDFAAEMAAEAFATRFDGVHHSSPQSTSPDWRFDFP
jgi:hypothetical protein